MRGGKKLVVLGCGRVGRAVALDLSQRHEVVAVDTDPNAAQRLQGAGVEIISEDAANPVVLGRLVKDADLIINALPGYLGFDVLRNTIRCGRRVVDISFFSQDPFALDELARNEGVVAAVDCGVAPGLSNMIVGHHYRRMQVSHFACYVGGLPRTRTWPYQYKAPFSPADVIEEYMRPARLVENGEMVVKAPLSEVEYINFDDIGTLEAFNTDGLRTLLSTTRIPNMKEKTLRYPGHSEYIRVLRETGFFSNEPIDINGQKIAPLEMTSRLLFPHWQLAENEDEFTVMKIVIEGKENGQAVRYAYYLRDQYDRIAGLSSMARTTGFTCTAVADLVLEGRIREAGIVPPELIGMDQGRFDYVMQHLKGRNICLSISREALS
jgi:lysine 6-dehydrogenase